MMFDQIEKLKQDLTDKYVVVDPRIAELHRFEGHVGQVKTVNMSGRALVQFEAWNNIGWYDIGVDFLKVVPKPEPAIEGKKQEAAPKAAAKPAAQPAVAMGEKKLSPLEMARMQGAAKGATAKPPAPGSADGVSSPGSTKPTPAAAGKKSTAEILAAARAAKAAGAPATTPAASGVKPASTDTKPPAAPKAKLSTADILAAARAKATDDTPAAQTPVASVAAPEPAQEKATAPAAAVAAKPKPAPEVALKPGQRPSVSEILVWCRQHDSK